MNTRHWMSVPKGGNCASVYSLSSQQWHQCLREYWHPLQYGTFHMNPLVQLHILRMFQTLNAKLKFGTLSLLVVWLTD